MITADQLLAHVVGDYVIQSDWMANEKTKKSVAALVHAMSYTFCFLFLTFSWKALLVIGVTHFFIDRFRLARYVCWVKNFLAPKATVLTEYLPDVITPGGKQLYTERNVPSRWWYPWAECSGTGYHKDRPVWMAVWLMIIADNTMHVVINGLALMYLTR